MFGRLFGAKREAPQAPVIPDERVREWRRQIKRESRQIDRQIEKIECEEGRLRASLIREARADRRESVAIMARELVRSKRAKGRLYVGKAQLNSIALQFDQLLAQAKLTKTMAVSAELSRNLNKSLEISSISGFMRTLSDEMIRANLIEETFSEALEAGIDDGDLDRATEQEFVSICREYLEEDLLRLVVPQVGLAPGPPATSANSEEPTPPRRTQQAELVNTGQKVK
jgi:charged multivesicular body protein 3